MKEVEDSLENFKMCLDKQSHYIFSLRINHKKIQSKRLLDFIYHIRKKYDINNCVNEWSLIKVLESGFAMHHGKLPRYIQNEILRQFNDGNFDMLFCTSTIIEGVNTKAKNMVLLNSTKGREPLTPFDIKNIKGRAGRYYHNFVGRVFYTDRRQKEIEDETDMILDFAIYRDNAISIVDLDNAEIYDLAPKNKELKYKRLDEQKNYKLSNEIFIKNRLVPKDVQERLLQLMLNNDEMIEPLLILLKAQNIRKTFLDGYKLQDVLTLLTASEIIDETIKKIYNAVAYTYYKKGFKGLLQYEIDKAKTNHTSIDSAYSKAFKTLKDIIEYKIPKILSLFESIFTYICIYKGYDMTNFSLSPVIRFFETGVYTDFGEYLIEYGFPTDTVRELENNIDLSDFSVEQAIDYYKIHKRDFILLFDEYEKLLFEDAIKSFIK